MEIADLFIGGVHQLWRKPAISAFNIMVWLLVFASTSLLLSGIFSVQHALILSSFNVFFLLVTYYSNVYLVDKLLERKQYVYYFFCFLMILACIALLRVRFNLYYLKTSSQINFPIGQNWVYLFSIITTLIVLTISFFNALLMNRSRKEKEYQTIIEYQREAHVEFLKAQMSPHFLFNTLNNIYSLSIAQSPAAPQMILLLSEILRYVVYETRQRKVRLASEIEQIRKLMQLYQMKSENKLSLSLVVNVSQEEAFIEPMILIPLVENCFKHSNIDTNEKAYISLKLREENGTITFESKNFREDIPKVNLDASGVGLKNIKERLAIRYADRHILTIEEKKETFFVQLQISGGNG